jgi:carbamoyl-phosphate synthase large subunit
VELLRAFRHAYEVLDLGGKIIALDIDPLAPALRVADKVFIVPRLTSEKYIPELVGICTREKVDLLFPLIDPDIPVLAAHRASIEAAGTKLAVVSAEAAAICGDKWETKKFFRRLGLATSEGWLPEEMDFSRAEYPLFIKPRGGSAATNTFKVETPAQLRFFADYIREPMVEAFLPGVEITNDVICDLSGEVLGVISRQRIEVRWGEVAKGVTVDVPAIREACISIARGLPAVGPITVQCIMKNGEPHFTEINARLGGGVPLGIAAGADSPRWLLARAAGLPLDPPPLGSYKTGLYMTRYDDSYFLSQSEHNQMAGHRF